MADDLNAIVTSHIDGLVKIKQEEAELRGLIDKAAARKDQVAEAVYARVIRDYESRIAALDLEARPLREQARAEFAKLLSLHRLAEGALEKAKLDQQEIEFRHDVGEFSDEEFEKRIGDARATVDGCQSTFDRSEALRQRFLEVVPDQPVIEPAPAGEPGPSVGQSSEAAAPSEPVGAPPPEVGGPDVTGPVAAPADGGTLVGPDGRLPAPAPPTDTTSPEVSLGPEGESFATVAISPAVLVEEGGSGATYKLGALTSIGRVASNTIVIPVREVSRNHAQILLTETGYVLKDLESGNGTFVNGQRIREWRLTEDDRVQIGERTFHFKSR